MNNVSHDRTFRGLPLTAEQDSEINHYIHVRSRNGLPWDTRELRAMIADMLAPPELPVEDSRSLDDCVSTEHAVAMSEEYGYHTE